MSQYGRNANTLLAVLNIKNQNKVFPKCNLRHHRERLNSRASGRPVLVELWLKRLAPKSQLFSLNLMPFSYLIRTKESTAGSPSGRPFLPPTSWLALARVPLNQFNYESSGASTTEKNFPLVQFCSICNENTTKSSLTKHLPTTFHFSSSSVLFRGTLAVVTTLHW